MIHLPSRHQINWPATFYIFAALVCWTVSPLAIKQLSFHIDMWSQNLFRYSCALLFWLPFIVYAHSRGRFDNRLWRLALIPAFFNVVMQCFWAKSFYYLAPAFNMLLSKSSILFVAAFSIMLFEDERHLLKSPPFWLGLVLCSVGVAGVILSRGEIMLPETANNAAQRADFWKGIVLQLTHAMLWAGYGISSRYFFRGVNARDSFFVLSLYTVAGLAAAAFLFGQPMQAFSCGWEVWSVILFSGIIGIAFSHVLFYRSITRIGVTIPALILLLQPLTVFAVSAFHFDERFTLIQVFFAAVLLAGAGVSIWAQKDL